VQFSVHIKTNKNTVSELNFHWYFQQKYNVHFYLYIHHFYFFLCNHSVVDIRGNSWNNTLNIRTLIEKEKKRNKMKFVNINDCPELLLAILQNQLSISNQLTVTLSLSTYTYTHTHTHAFYIVCVCLCVYVRPPNIHLCTTHYSPGNASSLSSSCFILSAENITSFQFCGWKMPFSFFSLLSFYKTSDQDPLLRIFELWSMRKKERLKKIKRIDWSKYTLIGIKNYSS
jgi:hypothetical protein